MRSPQGIQALVQRRHELCVRTTGFLRLRDDSANSRKHVLDAMTELSTERALMFFRAFALRDVDVHADQPAWASIIVVGNQTARIDPTHFTATANDTVFYVEFSPSLLKSLVLQRLHLLNVVGVQAGKPFMTRDLGRSLGKAVDGGVSFVDTHLCRISVVRVIADEGGLTRQSALYVALLERALGLLVL